jgi:hypothetical protein
MPSLELLLLLGQRGHDGGGEWDQRAVGEQKGQRARENEKVGSRFRFPGPIVKNRPGLKPDYNKNRDRLQKLRARSGFRFYNK